MKRLQILRHAKSEHLFGIEDKDRKLSEKGMNDSKLIGTWLKENAEAPERILCSTSKRTRQTIKLLLKHAKWDPEIEYIDQLYLPYKEEIFQLIGQTDAKVESLLIIGHNPGFTELFNTLSYHRLDNLPTCGFAEFELTENWDELAFKKFEISLFQIPKKLR